MTNKQITYILINAWLMTFMFLVNNSTLTQIIGFTIAAAITLLFYTKNDE